MKNLKKFETGIILPLKESFSNNNFGAVSIWVNDYLNHTKLKNIIVFCKKIYEKNGYLNKNVFPITNNQKIFTNLNYIKKIGIEINKKKLSLVEIHNRPEYAVYLIKNYPNLKVNLIFHNDPNTIRYSDSANYKKFLLENCNKIIFVSKWVKKRFFFNLNIQHKNNTDIIYNFIDPINKFPKKYKTIIFAGKLNKSKGFNIFGKSITRILDRYPDWRAEVFGNEEREKHIFNHRNLKIKNWISHKKLLKVYERSSIAIVNPTWDEPFGRTALEASSRGCAVITSISGGLSETFNNNLILKNNNSDELYKKICFLIDNQKFLYNIQRTNFKNVINTPSKSVLKLDASRSLKNPSLNYINNYYKILHISNFGDKNNHRLFNLSIAKKISNGLIRNGHDVINFDYRSHNSGLFDTNSLDNKILSIVGNYKPDLILFGHNNCLKRKSIEFIKDNFLTKFALWYEDHVIKGDPSYKKNLELIELNNDLIDQYFITTSPEIIKTKIKKIKLNYLPIPVDPNIENGNFYENKKEKDIFFAISHGVNYGKLKKNTSDDRSHFVNDLINYADERIEFNLLGFNKEEPKWNYEFNNELMLSKTALNLSRGGPNKYASSNRIASLMGNGVLPFIHEKVYYQDFFDNDEIITYKNHKDLINKLLLIKDNPREIKKRSIKSKKSYFNFFQNNIVADFIIHKIFKTDKKFNYVWSK